MTGRFTNNDADIVEEPRTTFCPYFIVFCNWVFLLNRCTVAVNTSLSGTVIKWETRTWTECLTRHHSSLSLTLEGALYQASSIHIKPGEEVGRLLRIREL